MEFKVFILWYGIFIIFGIIGLPITSILLKDWKDKGYGLAKFIGLFVVAMFLWFLSSLRIIPFTAVTAWVFILIGLGLSIYWLSKQVDFNWKELVRWIAFEEAIFFVLMLIWVYIRGFNARAEGTEKMMNIAFMSSINRTEYFPPLDPWLSGHTINYYYLGHYLFTFAGKVVGLGIGYIYNYALVTIIAHSFISLFSIFINIFKKVKLWAGILLSFMGSIWICFGGNMHYIGSIVLSWFSDAPFNYYFPNATRIIPYTIDEFPAYSIVLGDVHGHYLGLPFIIIAIAFFIKSFSIKISSAEKIKFNLIISPLIMALYGINSWDVITINFLFGLLHLTQIFHEKGGVITRLKILFKAQIALWGPGILLILPYIINFSAPVVGQDKGIWKIIGLVPQFAISEISEGTVIYKIQNEISGLSPFSYWIRGKIDEEFWPWMAMWGMFIFITLVYIIFTRFKLIEKSKSIINKSTFLAFCSVCLIFGVELFFLKDIFHSSNAPYFRTNTVFKLYYQTWIIWGISAMWMVYLIIIKIYKRYLKALILVLILIFLFWIGSVIYIFKAVGDFYPLDNRVIDQTMDGIHYIHIEYDKVGDYEALMWINENIKGQPVIAEAVGEAYTYYARISAYSGLPTVIGWPTHEWQWRGNPEIAYNRKHGIYENNLKIKSGIDDLYKTTEINELLKIINEYDIKYIYVGGKEREKYPEMKETLFAQIADIVYEDKTNGVRVYKIRSLGIIDTLE